MNQQKLIEKIHAEFDTAQDRLLKEAHQILNNTNEAIVSISDRLKAIGFTNTPTAKRGNDLKEQLVKSTQEAELIEYYAQTYPFLKFLTESELDRICKKYNLVYAPIGRYTNEVPEKNICDIETAQGMYAKDIEPQRVWTEIKYHQSSHFSATFLNLDELTKAKLPTIIEGEAFTSTFKVDDYLKERYDCPKGKYLCDKATINTFHRNGLFIAAPETHFNTEGLTKTGYGFFNIFKTELKDPIVFRYVRGGVQVITKWGLEANDPALVVPALN